MAGGGQLHATIFATGTAALGETTETDEKIYFISETPLKFFVKKEVDLKKDTKLIDVTSDLKSTTIMLEDSATFGGTSKIKLNFDSKTFSLKQWEVTDPQGYQTLITLHNIDLKSIPDPALFQIPNNNSFPSQN